MYEKEKEKAESERGKVRTETFNLKKKMNEMVAELEGLKATHQQREAKWKEERENYEKSISNLKEKLDSLQTDETNGQFNRVVEIEIFKSRSKIYLSFFSNFSKIT